MRLGFTTLGIPPDEIVGLAVWAEQCGWNGVWYGEHLLQPASISSKYPYAPKAPLAHKPDYGDPLVVLGAIAAATTTISVGTAIYVLPLRHPLMAVRAATTVQTVSHGRLLLGLGYGWMREEFDAVDIPYEERGPRFDEALEILRRASGGGPFSFEGRHYRFGEVTITERNVAIPVVVAGKGEKTFARAARWGDAWYSAPAMTVAECEHARERIEALRAAAGTTARPFHYIVRYPGLDPSGLDRYLEAGFDDIVLAGVDIFPRSVVGTLTVDDMKQRLTDVAQDFGLQPVAG